MAIEYVQLTPERLDDVERLMLGHWNLQWDKRLADAYFRWRYLERANWEAILAYDGTRPVAFLDAFLRRFRVGAEVIRVRETGDWYCEPKYRPFVGIKLMRMMMDKPEPILVVGANENARNVLLGLLRWHALPGLPRYVLPIGPGFVLKGLSNYLPDRLSSIAVPLARAVSFRIRGTRRGAPPSGAISVSRIAGDIRVPEIVPPPNTCLLSTVLGQEEVDWFERAPDEMGEFVSLVFSVDGEPVGLSLGRIYQAKMFRMARLLHLQAKSPSAAVYRWMIAETTNHLAKHGAQWVSASFSCPMVEEALFNLGFMKRENVTPYWWDHGQDPPEGPLHMTWVSGDQGVWPRPN